MLKRLSYVGLLAFGPLLVASPASAASLADCGNIDVEANAMCEVDTSGGCTARCTPVNFEAQCDASGGIECRGSCTGSASATCTAACDVTNCEAECTANPPMFDCSANCSVEGNATCDGQCVAGSGHASCVAECQASVKARCDASCEGHPGTVDCHASCQASCQGQCEAQANVACDVKCQNDFHATCTSMLTGGCQADCSPVKGALFCDGQYVDTGDHLAKCEQALKAALNIQVTTHTEASGMSSCTTGQGCEAEGQAKASASCSLAPGFSGSARAGWILAGLGLAAFGARRRRR